MIIHKTLIYILTIIFSVNIIVCLYLYRPRFQNANESPNTSSWSWKETVWLCLFIIAFLLVVFFPMIISPFVKINWNQWYYLFFGVMILRQLTNIIPSVKAIGQIITKNTRGKLKPRESFAIILFAAIIIALDYYHIFESIIQFAHKCNNLILGDSIVAITYFLTISFDVFFICALSIVPLQFFVLIVQKLLVQIKKLKNLLLFKKLKEKIYNDKISTKTLTSSYIEFIIKKQKTSLQILLWPLVIFIICIDIIYQFVHFICINLLVCLWYVLSFIKQIVTIIAKLGSYILSLSVTTVIGLSFRVSVILGLTMMVVINRYNPFLRMKEENTEILEFISSAIIIPIIIEWVMNYKNNKESIGKAKD